MSGTAADLLHRQTSCVWKCESFIQGLPVFLNDYHVDEERLPLESRNLSDSSKLSETYRATPKLWGLSEMPFRRPPTDLHFLGK